MAQNNSKKIAIIEDERILLKALKTELSSEGFEVISATDGETGIELIKKEKPDLLLLDLVLPRIDGFEVLKRIKKDSKVKDVPVLILSNLGQDENIERGMKLGAVDYFVKASTDLATIAEKINNILS